MKRKSSLRFYEQLVRSVKAESKQNQILEVSAEVKNWDCGPSLNDAA